MPLFNAARYWKDQVIFTQITPDQLPIEIQNKCFYLEKIDGELNSIQFDKKSDICQFLTIQGTSKTDLPVLDEYKSIISKVFNECKLIGELVAIDGKRILPFSKSMSIVKTAYRVPAYKHLVHHFVFDIVSINNKIFDVKNQYNYQRVYSLLYNLFKNCKYIHIPRMIKGDFKRAWYQFVDKDKMEGLVVRCPNKVYKIKKTHTIDAVIVKVGNKAMKSWFKNQISYLTIALMDQKGYLRISSNIGTGFTDRERADLFRWAYNNKVFETDYEVWVKPNKVVEIEFQEYMIQYRPAVIFRKGRYISVGKYECCTLRLPRLKRYRNDKQVSFRDIGIHQIPELR